MSSPSAPEVFCFFSRASTYFQVKSFFSSESESVVMPSATESATKAAIFL